MIGIKLQIDSLYFSGMSNDKLKLFLEALKDNSDFAEHFKGLSSSAEIVTTANSLGFTLEESDFPAQGSEVALDELASICGGIIAYPQADD